MDVPSGNLTVCYWNMAHFIVDLPIKMVIFHIVILYSLPDGTLALLWLFTYQTW